MPVTMQLMLVEELDNSRIVTSSNFEVIPKRDDEFRFNDQLALINTYDAFQRGNNDADLIVWASRLLFLLNENHKFSNNDLETKRIVIFCRGSLIYTDLFDKQLNSKDICSVASSMIKLNLIKLSCNRFMHDSSMN